LIKLGLFLSKFFSHPASFTQNFGLKIRFVADDINFDVLFASFPNEINPLGNAFR